MRFVLCVAAAAMAVVSAAEVKPSIELHNQTVGRMQLPMGIPIGGIVTFYFKHTGNDNKPESVTIDFYNKASVIEHETYDILAHIDIQRQKWDPVGVRSFLDGNYTKEIRSEQPPGELPGSNQWWRVDVVMHDINTLNIFFQGYWTNMFKCDRPLNELQSVYVISKFIDLKTLTIKTKFPISNRLPVISAQNFTEITNQTAFKNRADFHLYSFPNLPIGTHIQMTVLLRASAGAKEFEPALVFFPAKGERSFLRISQKWEYDTEALYTTFENTQTGDSTPRLCTKSKPHGDLQHLALERSGKEEIKLTVFYKDSVEGIACAHTIPHDLIKYIDRSFDVKSHDGALLFHLNHDSIMKTHKMKRR